MDTKNDTTLNDIEQLIEAMPSPEYFLAFSAALLAGGLNHFIGDIAEFQGEIYNATRTIREVLDELTEGDELARKELESVFNNNVVNG